jgi:DNA-binding NtrC family response regulator
MRSLMAKIERVAGSSASVLLIGETGTGKELIAHAIHEASPRANKPFETVDCDTLLPTLIASELFGHEKGAFTGADRAHVGAFERANGGTILLDEIGELPQALQVALLGVIERRSLRRVGGDRAIPIDVRVVSATHRDLRAEVNGGSFRQDLYYRLAVVLLPIPALRDRPGDIPLLVEHFLSEAGHDAPVEEVVPEAVMAALQQHRWPGNVRELRNFVEAALAMGETPELVDGSAPPANEQERAAPALPRAGSSEPRFPSTSLPDLTRVQYKHARQQVLNEFESFYLRQILARSAGNIARAARDSGLNRSHLTQMLKRHGITR